MMDVNLVELLEDPYTEKNIKLYQVTELLTGADLTDDDRREIVTRYDSRGFFPLLVAAALGDVPICRLLIKNGAPVVQEVQSELASEHVAPSAVHQGCDDGNFEIVCFLKEQVKKEKFCEVINAPNYKGETPCHSAVKSGNLDLVSWLFDNGGDVQKVDDSLNNMLHYAFRYSADECLVALLLRLKLSPLHKNTSGVSPLILALSQNISPVLKLFWKSLSSTGIGSFEKKLLGCILHVGHSEYKVVLDSYLEHLRTFREESGTNPDDVLSMVSFSNIPNLLEETIKVIAETKPKASHVYNRKLLGHTPLTYACRHGNAESVKILLKNGANPNQELQLGQTALSIAVLNGDENIICILLKHGSDCSKDTSIFRNALFLGNLRTTQLLLAGGLQLDNSHYWCSSIHKCCPDAEFLLTLYYSGHLELFNQYVNTYYVDWWLHLTELLVSPPTLLSLSVLRVRGLLGSSLWKKVEALPVPSLLKKQLRLGVDIVN